MQAIELRTYGGPEALKLVERPEPVPAPGQVIVRMMATSLNPIDPKRASGLLKAVFPLRFPFVPGGDVSGVVEAIGEGAGDLRVGDEVFGYSAEGGAYAERIALAADNLARKPANLTHAASASLALVGQTATQALEAAGVTKGSTLVIVGAGGAVGSVAVQVASCMGAMVVAVASKGDVERLRRYGAAEIIDRDTAFWDRINQADAVIDAAGGEAQQRAFAVLRKGGILVALSQPPSKDEVERYGVRGVMLATQTSRSSLDALRDKIQADEVAPFTGRHYPLAEVAQAWRDAAARTMVGKSIIEIA